MNQTFDSYFRMMFWFKVVKTPTCWLWVGTVHRTGYGVVHHNSKQYRCNRVAYILTHGPIADGLYVCHTCDNPLCVNPEHLFLGTTQQNTEDKIRKGRQLRGEKHGRAKLTESQVLEILVLRKQGMTCPEIVEKLGTPKSATQMVFSGINWSYLQYGDK